MTVVAFHLCESHAGGDVFAQVLNHGYLAVDFFFLLSGFVLGYAYDDRWGRMTYTEFLKRRLVRLQPMVVMGSIVGAACFYFGGSALFPMIASTPVWKMILLAVLGMALLPVPVSWDIRGWDEMYPLNGPAWSLFYEYLANFVYALVLRRLGIRLLALLALIAGAVTIQHLSTNTLATMIGGWTLNTDHVRIGFTRLAYPFLAGMLVYRLGWKVRIRHGFWWCSMALFGLLAAPRLGTPTTVWPNALYESACILLIFPAIVAAGAGSELVGVRSSRICLFLGRLSYPIYITHYPLIYLYMNWVVKRKLTLQAALPLTVATFAVIIAVSYAALRFYDEPVRAYFTRRSQSQ